MYRAEGIELTASQYDALVHVMSGAGRCAPHDQGAHETSVYRELEQSGLIAYHADAARRVTEAWATRKGRDWMACLRHDQERDRRLARRDWLIIAVNIGGGALAGGVVSLVVSIVTSILLH